MRQSDDKIVLLPRDFIKGRHDAMLEVAKGNIDIEATLMLFQVDKPDTEYKRGYQSGLIKAHRSRIPSQEYRERW